MAKLSLNKIKSYVKKQTHGGLSLHGLESSVKGAAKNPLTYAAASLLIPGVAPMALNALKAGAGALASGAGHVGSALASGAGKIAPMALSAIDHLGGASGLLDKGLGVAQIANAANLQRQSTDYATHAMDTVNQSYGERAPLRVAGIEGLLKPKTPDLSTLRRTPGNPFGAPIPVGG